MRATIRDALRRDAYWLSPLVWDLLPMMLPLTEARLLVQRGMRPRR
jgi:hypothetical protein